MRLVITEFECKTEFGKVGRFEQLIMIKGRTPGFFFWLFKVLQIETGFTFVVNSLQVSLLNHGFITREDTHIPIVQITSISSGFKRNIYAMLFLALSIIHCIYRLPAIVNSINPTTISILLASVLIVCPAYIWYSHSEAFFIQVETKGGSKHGFSFSKSLIERFPVSSEMVEKVTSILNQVILYRLETRYRKNDVTETGA
jgi:hypothetical protein